MNNISSPFSNNNNNNKKFAPVAECEYFVDDEDDDDETDSDFNKNVKEVSFDEEDELMAQLNLGQDEPTLKTNNSDDNDSSTGNDLDKSISLLDYPAVNTNQTENTTGKSKFYFPIQEDNDLSAQQTVDDHDLDLLSRAYLDEKFICDLKSTSCSYTASSHLTKSNSKDLKLETFNLNGRLVLTTFRLMFIPYTEQSNLNKAFNLDKRLQLFNQKLQYTVIIPLGSIYQIRASTLSSEKYKKLKSLDLNNVIIKDMVIKCKNFMTKFFTFNEKNIEYVSKMAYALNYYSDSQFVIHNRFHYLINQLYFKKNMQDKNLKESQTETRNQQIQNHLKRKSYLVPGDLQQELIDCDCDSYMQVKSGYAEVIPNKFIIDSNMPFFALPKNVGDLLRKRVVVNESNVLEFSNSNEINSTLDVKKTSKLSSFLGSSPRSAKSVNQTQQVQYQSPILASSSITNPFHNNRFPFWAYTDPNTSCSLIVVPEASPNRQDECDIIIKNYNCLINDEVLKKKNKLKQDVNISNTSYGDYDFFKLQVPFSYEKIEQSYIRLLNICSFKLYSDYEEKSNTFYSQLNNSKWLGHVSTILSLTGKIVNCLNYFQKNVFLEERRNNMDCSCIITSLTKICLNSKYRTIVGLENLIQKDWFLTGHLFFKRLYQADENTNSSSDKRRGSLESNASLATGTIEGSNSSSSNKRDIAPTFLLFLDCLFQLIIQYPSEFEFNEFYLINLWDFSLTGLSFTYSFNGASSWLTYLNNQTFMVPTNADALVSNFSKNTSPKFENSYVKEIFEENNKFWLNHLEKSVDSNGNSIFVNKFFQINSKKDLILIPCERIYLLKFWSRCYLRWIERYHPYNSHENDYKLKSSIKTDELNENIPIQSQRAPPIPPKPKIAKPQSSNSILVQSDENNTKVISVTHEGTILVTTRITPDGNIESSF